MTTEDFASADDAVLTMSSPRRKFGRSCKGWYFDEMVAPSTRDIKNSIELLKNLCLPSEIRYDQMQDLISKFETLIAREK